MSYQTSQVANMIAYNLQSFTDEDEDAYYVAVVAKGDEVEMYVSTEIDPLTSRVDVFRVVVEKVDNVEEIWPIVRGYDRALHYTKIRFVSGEVLEVRAPINEVADQLIYGRDEVGDE